MHMRPGAPAHANVRCCCALLGRFRPILLLSTNIELDASNWSTQLVADVNCDFAFAILERRRSVWEPLLVAAPDRLDQVQSIPIWARIEKPPPTWIDHTGFTVIAQSNNIRSQGTVSNLSDGQLKTFWDGGSVRGRNYLVCGLRRVTTLSRFR